MQVAIFNLMLCVTLAVGLMASALAADESMKQADMAPMVQVGNAKMLAVDGKKTLSIYTASTVAFDYGALLILHDAGSSANDPSVIAPLRKTMPDYGWSTLTIDLPYPSEKMAAKLDDKTKMTIKQALTELATKKPTQIILVGEGKGAAAAWQYALTESNSKIKGLVLISADVGSAAQNEKLFDELSQKSGIYVMDMVAENDLPQILRNAKQRKLLASKNSQLPYRYYEITGAYHNFVALEGVLVKRLRLWLRQLQAM